jgi:hypothetical protein
MWQGSRHHLHLSRIELSPALCTRRAVKSLKTSDENDIPLYAHDGTADEFTLSDCTTPKLAVNADLNIIYRNFVKKHTHSSHVNKMPMSTNNF